MIEVKSERLIMTAEELLTEEGLAHTHWGQRIIAAEKTGCFTCNDKDNSADWVTCACGKSNLPHRMKDIDSAPLDATLRGYGMAFWVKVVNDDFLVAARILIEIENRVIALMKETSSTS